MKEKYIEERFNKYFIFGERENSPLVDLVIDNNGTEVIVVKESAERIIQDRDRVVDMLCKIATALNEVSPEIYDEILYGRT